MPRVSIVVPAFNNAAYLGQTLASALAQTYPDLEVVVADHSSTDETATVLDRFDGRPRLRVLSATPAGGGAKANWDRVSQAATGELLKLLPGDDLLDPTLVARQVEGVDAAPGVALSCCNRRVLDARGGVLFPDRGLPASLAGRQPGAAMLRRSVRAGTNVFGEPGAVLLRRELLAETGWWDDTQPYLIDLRSYAAVILAGLARGAGDVWVVPEPLAAFRVNAGQWSVRLAGQQASMTRAFHHDLARQAPGLVGRADVALGDARASANALGRQLVYRVLAARLR